MAPRTPIAIAVVEHQDRLLIGRRGPDSTLPGLWEFPGGKIEPDESPQQAAARECLEETGLAVRPQGEYADQSHDYEHGGVRLHFILCRPLEPGGAPRPPFRWVPRSELHRYTFPAGNAAVLERLRRGAPGGDPAVPDPPRC